VLVPSRKVTSLGSAIFAFLAAGTFKTIEEAQTKICPPHNLYNPQPEASKIYDRFYDLYRRIYFAFGQPKPSSTFGDILPTLMKLAKH
jgi:L-ribulokinase